MRIFAKFESMVGTGKASFEIAQHGIDSPKRVQILGSAASGNKKDFALEAPSGLATGVFPAKIGIPA